LENAPKIGSKKRELEISKNPRAIKREVKLKMTRWLGGG